MEINEINKTLDEITKQSQQVKKNIELVEATKIITLEKEIKRFVKYAKRYFKKHASASSCFQYSKKYTKRFERHFSSVYFFSKDTYLKFAGQFADFTFGLDTKDHQQYGVVININITKVNDITVYELRNIVIDKYPVWPGKLTVF